MSHPSLPDPAVARGAERIEYELRRSLIMPRPAAAIRAILAALNAAEQAMREPAADSDPYAVAAGVLLSLLDSYRRALAELGADR